MENAKGKTSIEIGMPWILFLIFLVLKLTGHINWSWTWIFAPLWIPFVFLVFVSVVLLTPTLVKYLLNLLKQTACCFQISRTLQNQQSP